MKKIFISYSHEDEEWKDRVVKHLRVLPDIDPWDDQRINVGANWFQEIENALNSAEIAILLVSADFLISEFIGREEIPRLLQRRKQEGLIIFPVILRDCVWKRVEWLSQIQSRPKDGKPLAKMDEKDWESELTDIAGEVFDLLDKITQDIKLPLPAPQTKIPERCFIEIGEGKFQSLVETSPRELAGFGDPLHDPTQRALGESLFGQLFPALADGTPPDDVDLRISASEESVFSLPWHVLAHKGIFLSSLGWTVSLSSAQSSQLEFKDCALPDLPKVLVVAPEPADRAATGAKAHLEELERELSVRNHTLRLGGNLQVADTWEGFIGKLERFSPDVVYFYGHCMDADFMDGANVLCMADDTQYATRKVRFEELQTHMEKGAKPVLVYLNGIGSSTGLLRFGTTLERSVPAVMTSRYLSSPNIAREQGLKLLIDILTRGVPPHRAVAELFGKLDTPLTTTEARWMTPLIFRRYDEWHVKVPESPARKLHDPYWYLKLDRISQFSTVAIQTLQMVREGRPRALAFMWYGTQGQGVERFHQRLNVELREYLVNLNAHIHEVRPDWSSQLDDPIIAFRDCLAEAFGVKSLDDIPGAIRKLTQGASGRQTLVYVRHAPVTSSRLINPKSLKVYLDWWDREFVPLLERNQFALLGVSFVVNNPPRFRNLVMEKERIEDLPLKHTVFRLLDEMEELAQRDIADFFKTHNIHLPVENRDRIIEKVLEETGGHYEKTVAQLQTLVNQSWDLRGEEPVEETVEDEYDY